jgi:hypothetical protein
MDVPNVRMFTCTNQANLIGLRKISSAVNEMKATTFGSPKLGPCPSTSQYFDKLHELSVGIFDEF